MAVSVSISEPVADKGSWSTVSGPVSRSMVAIVAVNCSIRRSMVRGSSVMGSCVVGSSMVRSSVMGSSVVRSSVVGSSVVGSSSVMWSRSMVRGSSMLITVTLANKRSLFNCYKDTISRAFFVTTSNNNYSSEINFIFKFM